MTTVTDIVTPDDAKVDEDTPSTDSFILRWIRVKNFRRFVEADLELPASGLTGISGVNGSGKSSFLVALMFCLFGQQPKDVNKDELRYKNADFKTEPTIVSVGFQHAGQTVEVIRRISGTRHTVTADIFLDGKPVTIATGSTAAAWVVSRLGMGAQGFQTAVVVPQDELNDLINAVPSVRRERIEKLAGIEDMNQAVKNARAEEGNLSKEVAVMLGSAETAAELQEHVHELESTLDGLDRDLLDAQTVLDENNADVTSAESHLTQIESTFATLNQMVNDASNAQHTVDLKQTELNGISAQLDKLTQELSNVDFSAKDALIEQQTNLKNDYDKLTSQIAVHSGELSNAERALYDAQEAVNQLVSGIQNSELKKSKIVTFLDSMNADELSTIVENDTQTLADIMERAAGIKVTRAQAEKSIDTLTHAEHNKAECPTCHAPIKDAPAMINEYKASIQMLNDLEATLRTEYTAIKSRLDQAQKSVNDLTEANRQLIDVDAYLATANDSHVKAVEKATALGTKYEALRNVDLNDTRDKQQSISTVLEGVNNGLNAILRAERDQMEQLAVGTRLEAVKGDIVTLTARAVELNNKIQVFGDYDALNEEIQSVRQAVHTKRQAANDSLVAAKNIETKVATLSANLTAAGEKLKDEQRLIAKKRLKLNSLVEKTATTGLLEEYRKNRIAQIAPEMSATASEMISRMTNDAFTEIVVREDFSTYVIDSDDNEFSVSVLSGGERSIVALALRIAIGSLITGENAGLLWLDEVLPAQDKERRDAILSVLRSLPIHQIVMINHTHDAEDIVDNVVKVYRDKEGSRIG